MHASAGMLAARTRTRVVKLALALTLVALALHAGAPGAAHAQRGSLNQSPTTDGCINHDGSDDCTDADLLTGAFDVAFSPNGKHAYVALIDVNAVAVLTRNPRSGALAQLAAPLGCVSQDGSGGLCATGRGLRNPVAVTVSPDGRHVYVVSHQRDPVTLTSIALFARDAKTGALTQLPGAQGCISEDIAGGECTPAIGVRGVRGLAVSRDGRHVYAASSSDAVAAFARDAKSGALTQLPAPYACISQSGNGGQCTQGKALDGAHDVAISRDGRHVYVTAEHSRAVAVFARDRKTGALAQLPGEDGCIAENGAIEQCTDGVGIGSPTALALSPDGRSVYAISPSHDQLAVMARDPKTGRLRHVVCLQDDGSIVCEPAVAIDHPFDVTVSPDGRNVYVASREDDAVAAFARDRKSGGLTQLATPAGCMSDDGSASVCRDGRALRIPRAVAVSKNGRQVYAATQGSSAVAVLQRAR